MGWLEDEAESDTVIRAAEEGEEDMGLSSEKP